MKSRNNPYKRHRFPPEIIQYAVWLYYRFNLSHRDIEELLAERGMIVTRESVRLWCHLDRGLWPEDTERACVAVQERPAFDRADLSVAKESGDRNVA